MRTTGLASLIGGYAVLRLWVVSATMPATTPDSVDYARVSHLSLLDPGFYGAIKPWAVPLLWKLVPDPALVNGSQVGFTRMAPLVVVQTLISVAAWLFLASVVASLFSTRAGRVISVTVVLLFSLSSAITDWDSVLLSESLSLSLTAVSLGCLLLLVRRPSVFLLCASLGAVFLWSSTRDTNAWYVLFALPVVALGLWRAGRARLGLALALGALAIVAGVQLSFAAGHRGDLPTTNAMIYQMATQPGAIQFFVSEGMPVRRDLLWLLSERPIYRNHHDPRLAPFRAWFAGHGKQSYLRWLAAHPEISLGPPLRNVGHLYAPMPSELAIYRSPGSRSSLPRALDHLVYPRRSGGLAAFALLALLSAAFLARKGGIDRLAIVPAAVLLSTLPVALIVWNGDSVELDRHLLGGAILARLGVLVLACIAVDGLLVHMSAHRRVSRSLLPELSPLPVGDQ